ncbi:MAG: membrane integrity-associated transporter subunit PqiC [Polaromonas sp.]|nr:membrane integrity-associated transporter subunit PqiC [Polaromonas sp.]
MRNASKSIAGYAMNSVASARFTFILAISVLAGCSALPDKPVRPVLYDFGPGTVVAAATKREAALPAVALEDITTVGGALDNTALLYRLTYANEQQLRPYAAARWSTPPAQLVRQRLREKLSETRPVFGSRDGLALNRPSGAPVPGLLGARAVPPDSVPEALPLRLRLELEEFSHLFTAPDTSMGVIRLRATLIDISRGGERLVGQRSIVVQRPATTADAPGGVRALTAATDAAIDELDQWLQTAPVPR